MDEKANILVIDDEEGMVMTLQDRLEEEYYRVDFATNGLTGFEKACEDIYDIIILDLMLPKKGGLDICKDLRQNNVHTPIIMLTGKCEVLDKVLGLKLGADDYMKKPFEMMELLARIEVQLRKKSSQTDKLKPGKVEFDDIEIDFKKRKISKSGNNVNLNTKEFKLLRFLIENEDIILTRDQLLNEVWGYDTLPSTRTVDVHIAWLRQKLEYDSRHPVHIHTVHGIGYRFSFAE